MNQSNVANLHVRAKTPELDVVRVVSLKNKAVLLVQEADDINWKLPGGKIHAKETIYEAFVREVQEELGLDLSEDDVLTLKSVEIPDSVNIRHIMLINPIDQSAIMPTQEVVEARYFDINQLPPTKFKQHILSAIEIVTT